jgi:hypothetical protein
VTAAFYIVFFIVRAAHTSLPAPPAPCCSAHAPSLHRTSQYPSVTAKIFTTFNCVEFDGEFEGSGRFLRVDLSVDCNAPERGGWLAYAIIMCLIYPLGVPLVYAYLLLVRFRGVLEEMRNAEQHAIAVQTVVNLQGESRSSAGGEGRASRVSTAAKGGRNSVAVVSAAIAAGARQRLVGADDGHGGAASTAASRKTPARLSRGKSVRTEVHEHTNKLLEEQSAAYLNFLLGASRDSRPLSCFLPLPT